MPSIARGIVSAIAAAVAIASGGYILFWIAGFLSFFVVERFRQGSGGLGAVSVGVLEPGVLLVLALPVCAVLNRRLRMWARATRGSSARLHRIHSWSLLLVLLLTAIAAAHVFGAVDMVDVFTVLLSLTVVVAVQFVLLGAVLLLYAAALFRQP